MRHRISNGDRSGDHQQRITDGEVPRAMDNTHQAMSSTRRADYVVDTDMGVIADRQKLLGVN